MNTQSGSALLSCDSEEEVGQKFRSNFYNRPGQGKQKQFVMQERQFRAKDTLFKQNQQLKQQIKKLEKEKNTKTQQNHVNQPQQKRLKVDDHAQMAMEDRDEWGVVYNPEHGVHARIAELVTEECETKDTSQNSPRSSTSEENSTNVEQGEPSPRSSTSEEISTNIGNGEHSNDAHEFSRDDESSKSEDLGASSKIKTDTSQGEEEGREIHCEKTEKMSQEAANESQESAGQAEFKESARTSYFSKMRKVMFKSMISLAVGVAFIAIIFSVWGIQLPLISLLPRDKSCLMSEIKPFA